MGTVAVRTPAGDAASGPHARQLVSEPAELLLRDLGSSRAGLREREATRRLELYGPNVLPAGRGTPWFVELGTQFTHPLALLLWLAAGLSVVSGSRTLGWAILGVIGVNALVAFAQERQAARAVEALAGYLPPTARVLRDSVTRTVPIAEVVRGDVLRLAEGDRVCADARLLDGALELDMSALTGESVPVTRAAGLPDVEARLLDAPSAVFSGTACTSGEATAVVFATGTHTELGRIAALAQRGGGEESPLQRQVRRTAWLIAAVAIGIGLLFLPLGLFAGLSLRDAAVFAVGLLVANVPEGLLPTITLALAVGVRVLARAGALVKRLSAVETLGSTTVICTDKTGTITQNTMAVERLWAAGREFGCTEDASVAAALAAVMADCNLLTGNQDPMEQALLGFAAHVGVRPGERVATYRFDNRRKRMSVVARRGASSVVSVKGAPESVLPLCTTWWFGGEVTTAFTAADRRRVEAAVDSFAQRGLRVLALAERRDAAPTNAQDAEAQLCLLGLVALLDPPRPEVADAVTACHRAGIRIIVVTGDHARTAAEIARQVGIRADRVISGPDVDAMTDAALDAALDSTGDLVFARSTPEGKLRIAEALRHRGDVVAMTGDGVNDAPALRRADIGVAMGRSGTDVAREAATMVLTDDDFATIVTAVREGRRVWENLRKFVLYIFAHAVPEVVPFAVFALSAGAVPLPLTVLQILAIDLGTETLPALALGREEAEPDVMDRAPRTRGAHLITRRLLGRAWLLMGSVSAALALGLYFLVLARAGWHPGAPVGHGQALHHAYLQATSVTFLAIVACQVGTAFAARAERAALRTIGLTGNRLLLAGIAFELVFAAGVVLLPPLQRVFSTAAPPVYTVPLLLVCPLLVWGADECYRYVSRSRAAHG